MRQISQRGVGGGVVEEAVMQGYCVLIFPTVAHVRAFYQRPEWQELAKQLTMIEPTHWRLPEGGDLYVLTVTSEQTASVVQAEEEVKVYLFRNREVPPARWSYLARMLASLHHAGKIQLRILDQSVAIDWHGLGILPPSEESHL